MELPDELKSVDFSERVCWRKYAPYNDVPFPFQPEDKLPVFDTTTSPALCHYLHALSNRARAGTLHLKAQPGQVNLPARPVPTPMFMPVGTKGCLKGITLEELTSDPALSCPIILGNTYHLALQPGTELVDEMDGLHAFQGLPNVNTVGSINSRAYNLLTDSGGYQMVSLAKLSEVTEEGVVFENPFKSSNKSGCNSDNIDIDHQHVKPDRMLLTPEDSIRHQNNISANIIMALDDVISSVCADNERFITATHRTLRWYDRCYRAHAKATTQNLFPIVQGGLDTGMGGLREQCLAGFRQRELQQHYIIPGYAVGGLAGGEGKDSFWRVVDQCCRALPDDKPRYLMGVGYPLDLVVCTALGCDMFDCVYPTRTARFGVALVNGKHPGTLRLKRHECATESAVIQVGCECQACRNNISQARLHALLKAGNPLAVQLITHHNVAYLMTLMKNMRQAIMYNVFEQFAIDFVQMQFPGKENNGEPCPSWVIDALRAANINIE